MIFVLRGRGNQAAFLRLTSAHGRKGASVRFWENAVAPGTLPGLRIFTACVFGADHGRISFPNRE
jgi:hypothetical protein